MDELDNIKERYSKRAASMPSPKKGDICFERNHRHEKERIFNRIIGWQFGNGFSSLKLLEVGAGTGKNLPFFIENGFKDHNIWANELLEDRITILKKEFPGIHVDQGDASRLNYLEAFDVVIQSTVFSSILDESLKKKPAETKTRMVRPGGLILWYDLTFDFPWNKHIKAIRQGEVRKLFPGAKSIRFYRVTLAPLIGRRVFGMYKLINFAFPFLRTHVIAEIQK